MRFSSLSHVTLRSGSFFEICSWHFLRTSTFAIVSLSPLLAVRSALGNAASIVCPSANKSSISTISMSETGSTFPATWMMSGSSKQRHTCKTASTSRMWLRNLLPSPWPSLAPLTMPAMSTSLTTVGTSFLVEHVAADPPADRPARARSLRSARSCKMDSWRLVPASTG